MYSSPRKGIDQSTFLEFEHNILHFNDEMPAFLYLFSVRNVTRIFIYSKCIIYKA